MEVTCIFKCLHTCKPNGGKDSVGGQKRQRIDVIVDEKECEMYPSWDEEEQDTACNRRGWIKATSKDVNKEMEVTEQSKKDELKQRMEAVNQEKTPIDWRCRVVILLEVTKQ